MRTSTSAFAMRLIVAAMLCLGWSAFAQDPSDGPTPADGEGQPSQAVTPEADSTPRGSGSAEASGPARAFEPVRASRVAGASGAAQAFEPTAASEPTEVSTPDETSQPTEASDVAEASALVEAAKAINLTEATELTEAGGAAGAEDNCPASAQCQIEAFLQTDCWTLADLGEPKKLADRCFFQERNLQVGGWLAQSFTWNPDNPVDRYNGPVTWNDRANEYQLNEAYFFLGKAADTKGCGVDFGYRADLMFGSNYRWITATGLESRINSAGSEYGLAIPQAYVELGLDNLTVKAGHFISPVGFHTVGTNNNFFSTAPYTCQYGEPFTHTGMLFTYKFSDRFTWANGFVRGWDNLDPTNHPADFPELGSPIPDGPAGLSWLSNATLTRENGDTLAWVALLGRDANLSGPQGYGSFYSPRYFQSLVYTKKFSENVTAVLQSDLGAQKDGATGPDGQGKPAYWYGLNSYLFWNQTCRLQWGLELEWFRDEDGVRVGNLLPSSGSPGARGWTNAGTFGGGYAGSFHALTFGPKYFFTPNVYGRAAYRQDWYNGEQPNGVGPFDAGTKDHQQLFLFDVVATF